MNVSLVSQPALEDKGSYTRGREEFIRLSLLAIMGVSCVLLLRPFLKVIICGIILSIAIYPAHRILTIALNNRTKLAAVLVTALLLTVVIVPSLLLTATLFDGIQTITHQVQAGRLNIPPAPSSLDNLPVIGPRLEEVWTLCTTNLSEAVRRFSPQIRKAIPAVLAMSAGIAGAILQFFIAIILAGVFFATSEASGRFADRVFARIFGIRGPEFKALVASTIRTVANGVIGVALIQTLFASLGFWLVGLPGAGLWALVFLAAAIFQVGAVILVPAVLYAFATFSPTSSTIFLVWCIVVSLIDNAFRPLLLRSRGKVPMIVILLGVLGGFATMNSIVGSFVGAVVLSVAYRLFMTWLNGEEPDVAAG